MNVMGGIATSCAGQIGPLPIEMSTVKKRFFVIISYHSFQSLHAFYFCLHESMIFSEKDNHLFIHCLRLNLIVYIICKEDILNIHDFFVCKFNITPNVYITLCYHKLFILYC